MILKALQSAALLLGVTLAMLASHHSAIADDYSDVVGRMSDPRFDIERYGRAYTNAMRVLGGFLKNRCVDARDVDERDKWVAYAEALARTLHNFAGRLDNEPGVDPALSQKQETLDMLDQLLGQTRRVRDRPVCPPPETTPAPMPEGPPPPSKPPPPLKLPPRLLALYHECASKDEQEKIRDLVAQATELKAQIAQLESNIADAQKAYNAAATEGHTGSDPLTRTLYEALEATKARDQPMLGSLNSDLNQVQGKVMDIFKQIEARGGCPPPGATQPPPPPPREEPPSRESPPPPKKKDTLDDILGHTSIGIGIGVGGGHGHHRDHERSNNPPATDAPPTNETPPPPHD